MNLQIFLTYLIGPLILTAILVPLTIPLLKRLKFGQSIRLEGPQSHMAKTGTPTMGGLTFLIPIILTSIILLFIVEEKSTILVMLIVTLGFGLIGFIDDYIIVVKKQNEGLSSKQKFLAQIVISVIVYFFIINIDGISTTLNIPGTGIDIPLGFLFVLWIIFWQVGFSNAVNLTDGLDGLATGLSIIAFGSFLAIAIMTDAFELSLFLLVVIGSLIGFLIYNKNKAKLFMGDTGSLALGGMLATVSIMLNESVLLLIIGIVFVIETASVMLQVASFKLTGKRIFKMTPIHHHFELVGWSEWKIVIVFWSVGLVFGAIGVWLGVM
ncbi:phospho-N-acetylmuramoyl-pentapeptide-transferase [Aliicoccus persicus]|uniref:Phospho-N-acetylmuramoyl-pentapeptide-transferase n=1 Tax=Aliicoccus persicus TaxID=930138 RepID=A0A662Z3M0_9STAP|nr:phospho-N-acetylmuramoyl-pentapeptide-transferase [Aliicoccus persicus]SEV80604.1 Phospho-N-acetylmuramoyl-pentapeptide-transferase [Aliicoccus persicus]HJE19157.1 phospho-N-acetylmuramoyl-pentapeptide-transferase [Aliicoccus persicus]